MRLCKECKFYLAETKHCGHETAVIYDFVNGNHTRFSAQVHRQWSGKKDCGPPAQFFEPAMLDVTPRPNVEVVLLN